MNRSSINQLIFITLFLLLISLPALMLLAGVRPLVRIEEKRKPPAFPTIDLIDLRDTIRGFEKYFNSRFGLRNELIVFNRALRYFGLNTSGNENVLIGRNGWLIYRVHPNLIETRSLEQFTPQQLKKWGEMLQARAEYVKKRSAVYLLVIAPDPKTIYPEILPEWIPAPSKPTRMAQLYDYLSAEHPEIDFLDLRPVLNAHRDEPIYFHTDTHWTTLGAYYAYHAILERLAALEPKLAEALRPTELSSLDLVPLDNSGDLARILGLPGLIVDQTIAVQPRRVWEADIRQRPIDDYNFITDNPQRPNAPRLVIFRDSYAWAFQALLAEHFSFAHFRWIYGFERKLVKRSKPDVVIQLMAERSLPETELRAFSRD